MTRNADFKRRVRERMARTGESYATARVRSLPKRTLHVTNGDIVVAKLAAIGIEALAWRDALHEGPVVKNGRELRAEFLGIDVAELEQRDRTLDAHRGEIVLWFEADLYDQLQIAEILWRLRGSDPERISLVQIGEHIGIPHSGGLGELEPEQLRELAGVRLNEAALRVGEQAWEALMASEPHGLLRVGSTPELRFMAEAFKRLAQEYPWRRDGLSLTERRLLAGAPGTKYELFERAWRKEQRPFMGDTFAFAALRRLAPLLDDCDGVLHLNDRGERVLQGEEEFVTERWIGGVHVTPATPWRWDDAREVITSSNG
jgi:hypothetical protein